MDTKEMETHVRIIFATELGALRFDLLDTLILGQVGFKLAVFLESVGVDEKPEESIETLTISGLSQFLSQRSEQVAQKVITVAARARLERIVRGSLLAMGQPPPAGNEKSRWWFELVRQTLWWSARIEAGNGVSLVRAGAPSRAMQDLSALGFLKIEEMAKGTDALLQSMVDCLTRAGYPETVAGDLYVALSQIAEKIIREYEGVPQRLLDRHANRVADAIAEDLLTDVEAHPGLSESVRSWLGAMTGLPVGVWSPSTTELVEKFTPAGVNAEMLGRLAESTGRPVIDTALAAFMDRWCRGCDPDKENQRYCLKQFEQNWQLQCPLRPEIYGEIG